MNARRTPLRIFDEEVVNDKVPLKVDKLPKVFKFLKVERLFKDGSPTFLGSKVGEDPQEFLDGVYKNEKFTEAFLDKYFPHEKKEVKVEDFINLKQECCTAMLHTNMNRSRYMVYAQSIEEFKLSRITRNLKRGISDEKNQPRFKKRATNSNTISTPNANYEKGGVSQSVKSTCSTFWKEHFGKCQDDTSEYIGCTKNDHKGRGSPILPARGREAKKSPTKGTIPILQVVVVSMLSKLTRNQIRIKVSVSAKLRVD
ncbi:hypothetical protein EJD97_018369 [Solanum chilense]|uniref:Uncharacterized protein n=1 Tax=Solanum chilense TaxID=4083 RepID=A0A6N2CK29_SOLCI|nr:hypothetical protein EJD97_018369 [Solanum chilense]